MEHTPSPLERPSEYDIHLALILEHYGEKNTDKLIAIFSAQNPELSHEEIVKVLYDIESAEEPFSTSWPDTMLDQELIFN